MSDEYPKVIETGGITVTVSSADDEARWRSAPLPPEPVAAPVIEAFPVEPVAAPSTPAKKAKKKGSK